MRCDKCVDKPLIRGVTQIYCPHCKEKVMVMIGNMVCRNCSEKLCYCEKCGDKIDKLMEIEYNI